MCWLVQSSNISIAQTKKRPLQKQLYFPDNQTHTERAPSHSLQCSELSNIVRYFNTSLRRKDRKKSAYSDPLFSMVFRRRDTRL